jgi:membrane protein
MAAHDEHTEVSPTDIPGTGRIAVLKRTVKEFQEDNITDWAASLTYYAVLALFPALLALVAIVGLAGQYPETTDSILKILTDAGADQSTVDSLRSTINGVVQNKGGAGALLGFGLLGALWSASGYIGAFMRASNAIWEKPEGRPFWKLRPLQVVVTLVMLLLLALLLVGLVVSGPLATAIGDQIGLGSTAATVYSIVKWPVMAAVMVFLLAFLYYVAPNAKLPRFQWISPGAVAALVIWAVATVGFFFYVRNFGSYNKTYGALGGAISMLVWLWITNIAILFGQQLNSEIERARELTAGVPAEVDIQLPLRDVPKKDREAEAEEISRDAREEMAQDGEIVGSGASPRAGSAGESVVGSSGAGSAGVAVAGSSGAAGASRAGSSGAAGSPGAGSSTADPGAGHPAGELPADDAAAAAVGDSPTVRAGAVRADAGEAGGDSPTVRAGAVRADAPEAGSTGRGAGRWRR